MIPQRIPSVELATRGVLECIGVDAAELPGYACCPDPVVARLMDRKMWLALSARNLALAEGMGLDLLVLCNGCYETLTEANEILRREPEARKETSDILAGLGRAYEGTVEVKHVVEVMHEEVGVGKIEKLVKRPAKLRLAVHPGCHLFREAGGGDIWRKPKQLEELALATGAEVVHCKLDRLCCGFPMMQVNEELALKRNLLPKLACYQELAVDAVVAPCPTCIVQFEAGQMLLRKYGARYNLPCLHIVEFLALALGIPAAELGLELHRSPVEQLARKMG